MGIGLKEQNCFYRTMPHKGQGIKSQYSQVALNNAVDAVKSSAMSVRQAS